MASAHRVGVDLAAVVASDLARIDATLPGPPVAINIDIGNALAETGEGGFYDGRTGRVTINLNPALSPDYRWTLTFRLKRVLAHELDHSVRILAGPGCGRTLLQVMVCEGMADEFATLTVTGTPNPWDAALTADQESSLWKAATPLLDTANQEVVNNWRFGDPPSNIPRWSAYTIGLHIVQAYVSRHPSTTQLELTTLSATEVLAGSGYDG